MQVVLDYLKKYQAQLPVRGGGGGGEGLVQLVLDHVKQYRGGGKGVCV